MQSIVILSLCVAAVASYGYAPSNPPTYGGYGTHHAHHSKPAMGSGGSPSSFAVLNGGSPQIVRLHHEIRENVGNTVQYETTNGIRSSDNTQILPGTPNPQNPNEMWNKIAKSGSYAYTSPEGKPIEIHWTADGIHGFRASGDAIPTPPPAPMM